MTVANIIVAVIVSAVDDNSSVSAVVCFGCSSGWQTPHARLQLSSMKPGLFRHSSALAQFEHSAWASTQAGASATIFYALVNVRRGEHF